MMNIELTYSEAVDIKIALKDMLRSNQEVLDDQSFTEKYPAITASLLAQVERDRALLERLQAELDKD